MTDSSPHPLQTPGISSRFVDPCIVVIFGATGDLTGRKLMPALYNLAREWPASSCNLRVSVLQGVLRHMSSSATR